MSEPTTAHEKLMKNKLKAKRKRLYKLLSIELVVLWIIHPSFIPIGFVEGFMTWLRDILVSLVWPQNPSEFFDNSFRYWVYRICTTIEGWAIWPMASAVLPWIIPALLVINYVRCWFYSREKSYLLYKTGADSEYVERMNAQVKNIQAKCESPKNEDFGIWFTHLAGGNYETDCVYHWQNDGKTIARCTVAGREEAIAFEKDADGNAYCVASGNQRYPMVKGRAFSIQYNLGDDKYQQCVATWLGGDNT